MIITIITVSSLLSKQQVKAEPLHMDIARY